MPDHTAHESETSLVADLAEVMSAVADTGGRHSSLDETLDLLVRSAADTIPGVEYAGISVANRSGEITTLAATGQVVHEVDRVQFSLKEGPCVDAIAGKPLAKGEDLADATRWPSFGPAAVDLGIRSMMGVELYADQESFGALNLYATELDAFSEESAPVAELFATYAAQAMGKVWREDQMQQALTTRKVIGQATGIVMERYQLDEPRAFGFLTRVSQDGNVKLRKVAEEIVRELTDRVQRESSSS